MAATPTALQGRLLPVIAFHSSTTGRSEWFQDVTSREDDQGSRCNSISAGSPRSIVSGATSRPGGRARHSSDPFSTPLPHTMATHPARQRRLTRSGRHDSTATWL